MTTIQKEYSKDLIFFAFAIMFGVLYKYSNNKKFIIIMIILSVLLGLFFMYQTYKISKSNEFKCLLKNESLQDGSICNICIPDYSQQVQRSGTISNGKCK